MHIDLVDATANVEFVNGTIQKRWGNDYVVVTNDGLELEDVPATQGQLLFCVMHACVYVAIRVLSQPVFIQELTFGIPQTENCMLLHEKVSMSEKENMTMTIQTEKCGLPKE